MTIKTCGSVAAVSTFENRGENIGTFEIDFISH
jgi:hypothetical protein